MGELPFEERPVVVDILADAFLGETWQELHHHCLLCEEVAVLVQMLRGKSVAGQDRLELVGALQHLFVY